MLHGNVPAAIARFHLLAKGDLPATNVLHLAIGLPLRDQAALDKLLAEIYDPASTNYHHYLTPEQFAERFGPSEQDYQSLIQFARTNGLTVTATYSNRALLDVTGSVAAIEKVFHVKLRVYQHPTENRTFYAPDTEPSIDFNLPILHVGGLDNYFIPHPASLKKNALNNQPTGIAPASGSGPFGNYMGNDFRAAYAPNVNINGVPLNGAGQVVGLLQLEGYYTNDIITYETLAGLPNVTLTNILIDGFSGNPDPADPKGITEVSLDIEMAISMATNLSKVIVYEATNDGFDIQIIHMLNRMANDNVAKQISSSWIIGDDPNYDTYYKQMAMQGQSFFQASGDNGAFYPGILQWADDTNITLVGGTSLTMTGTGGAYSSEKVWNWYSTGQGTSGSGGGTNLSSIPLPSYQSGLIMTTNLGSTSLRNVPDVALTADNIFVEFGNGQTQPNTGGTSCAAPLWAGFCALANQQAAYVGKSPVGFLNPAIYTAGKGPFYANAFHDITIGNNTNATVGNKYFAVPGYDLCTGWGTPNGQNLINALVPPDTLFVWPATGFAASGPSGGPFNPNSEMLLLTNLGAVSLNWSLINTSAWLNASSAGGALAAGASNNVTISLTTNANNLAIGSYAATMTLTNWNTHIAQFLQFKLQVNQLFTNGGFETGNFSGWTFVNDGFTTVSAGVSGISPHSGSYFALLGASGALNFLSQTLATTPSQPYLLSLWLNNPGANGNTPNEFSVTWNGTTLFDQVNMPATSGWTNLLFIATATNNSTVLRFGFRDDPYYLGLDDVNVTPIPAAVFQPATTTKTNNHIQFGWNALTGLVYQVQFKTNLLQPSWLVLTNLTPTNTPATFVDTNPITGTPQKFYRLQILP